MKNKTLVIIAVMLCMLTVFPVHAVTAEKLAINLDNGGNADVMFDYSLSFFEQIAVYLRITDPAKELKNALETNFNHKVEVISLDRNRAHIRIKDFAVVTKNNGITSMTTPALSFAEAEQVLRNYWFAPLINPDFSPTETRVVFPDGYYQTYYNVLEIPKITHVMR